MKLKNPTIKTATLRTAYCGYPSGTMFVLGEKTVVAGETAYFCYDSIIKNANSSLGFLPANLLNI